MLSQQADKSFEEVIEIHRDQVYRMCWGFANNAFDVDDIFQEVVINIWKGYTGFKGESSLSTWIYRITVNTCLLWKRRKNKIQEKSNEFDVGVNVVQEEVEDREKDENILDLRKAIQKLKKIDRTLILLLLEGCSYKEISEISGLTVSNVGAKISRIKTKIKQLMQNK